MAQLSTETLVELKLFFDAQLETTLSQIRGTDSDRLLKNKINGFLIAVLDKILDLKPKLACNGCGRVANAS